MPRSSVSLLLGFSAMLRVTLVSRVTARSLHDNMLARRVNRASSKLQVVKFSIQVGFIMKC